MLNLLLQSVIVVVGLVIAVQIDAVYAIRVVDPDQVCLGVRIAGRSLCGLWLYAQQWIVNLFVNSLPSFLPVEWERGEPDSGPLSISGPESGLSCVCISATGAREDRLLRLRLSG